MSQRPPVGTGEGGAGEERAYAYLGDKPRRIILWRPRDTPGLLHPRAKPRAAPVGEEWHVPDFWRGPAHAAGCDVAVVADDEEGGLLVAVRVDQGLDHVARASDRCKREEKRREEKVQEA